VTPRDIRRVRPAATPPRHFSPVDRPTAPVRVVVALALTAALLGVAVLAWGDWRSFFFDPPRAVAALTGVIVSVATALSGFNFSPGRREDRGNRWLFATMALVALCVAFLPPFMDRRALLTIDGDVARYAGATLWVGGNALRLAGMSALGERFSALVAIQAEHELVTDGVYGVVRHPSYLGTLLAIAGWALLFRSAVGLLLVAGSVRLAVARIAAEEDLLASHFGDEYAEYRRRTWRLVPFLY
jgi:protein-S-isoprenylcysteine O-methyltransferase Ste14